MAAKSTTFVAQLNSLADTQRLATSIADRIRIPFAIGLSGTLGSGKTQFAKYLCQALGVDPADVTSPTYVLVHRYHGRISIHHVDLYRLTTLAQAWDLGLDEMFESPSLTIVEWSDKFQGYLPQHTLNCHLEIRSDGTRFAVLSGVGESIAELLALLTRNWST